MNDRSPEAPLVAALQSLAATGLFSFETNATNLGFVKTCNAALRGMRGTTERRLLATADPRSGSRARERAACSVPSTCPATLVNELRRRSSLTTMSVNSGSSSSRSARSARSPDTAFCDITRF